MRSTVTNSLPAVGSPAPDFSLPNQHGETITAASLRGKPAIVVFFPAAFTSVCTGELHALRDHQAAFEEYGAAVVAVSTDTRFALRVFAESESLGFTLLSDFWPHGRTAQAYGVFDDRLGSAKRGSFVLDAAGTVRWSVLNEIAQPRPVTDLIAALAADTAE